MRRIVAVALATSAGFVITAGAAAAGGGGASTYTVHMTGSQDVPKGSPKGKGTFRYQLVTNSSLLCYSIAWSGIDAPYADHVHQGARGMEGPVVIPLSTHAPIAHSGCVKVKKSLLDTIKKNPSAYYVNVHTKKYPGGAIRGQL
jgi:CHRD domain